MEAVTTAAMPLRPRMLALDLACGKTGLAGHRADWDRPVVWTFDTTKLGLTGRARQVAILKEMARAVALVRPEVILLEDRYSPVAGALGPGFFSLSDLHAVVRFHLEPVAPLAIVQNAHIKVYATGSATRDPAKSKSAAKQAMMARIIGRYGFLLEQPIRDDNQADALALLALGSHAYGHPLPTACGIPLPPTHLRALTMVTGLPVIAGHESPAGATATTTRRSGRARKVAA